MRQNATTNGVYVIKQGPVLIGGLLKPLLFTHVCLRSRAQLQAGSRVPGVILVTVFEVETIYRSIQPPTVFDARYIGTMVIDHTVVFSGNWPWR